MHEPWQVYWTVWPARERPDVPAAGPALRLVVPAAGVPGFRPEAQWLVLAGHEVEACGARYPRVVCCPSFLTLDQRAAAVAWAESVGGRVRELAT